MTQSAFPAPRSADANGSRGLPRVTPPNASFAVPVVLHVSLLPAETSITDSERRSGAMNQMSFDPALLFVDFFCPCCYQQISLDLTLLATVKDAPC